MNFRIRAKGKTKQGTKWVIERRSKGSQSWESRTLMPLSDTWNKLCPDTSKPNVSNTEGESISKVHEKGVQDLLDEPNEEAIKRTLQEVGI